MNECLLKEIQIFASALQIASLRLFYSASPSRPLCFSFLLSLCLSVSLLSAVYIISVALDGASSTIYPRSPCHPESSLTWPPPCSVAIIPTMTALSAGHIAAIAVASSVLCAILAAILAGRIACKKASRNNEDRIEEPASRFYYEMSHELKKGSATPNPAELTLHIALCIDSLVGLRRFDIVPPELIEALKIAVPCDGVVGADWPLWESLLTNTEHENYKNNVDTVLSLLLAHWLVPKLQGTDETMTFLRPDFTSLRNKMMAKPQFDSECCLSLD